MAGAVESFASFLEGKPLHAATREDVESFTARLHSIEGMEDWKIVKAYDALRLLLTAVYGKRWDPAPVAPAGHTPDDDLDPLRAVCRVRRFVVFTRSRPGAGTDASAVRAFLEHLVVAGMVSPSTQAQALNALVFWFKQALGKELGELGDFQKSKRPRFIPVVLTRTEVSRLLAAMSGETALMAALLYGAGLRLQELITLGVKDVDFERQQIPVREGKGRKDRLTILPERYREPLEQHLLRVRDLWRRDCEAGYAGTTFPPSLERKYPSAPREWGRQFVFPASRLYTEPGTGRSRRHHVDESVLQRAVKAALRASGIAKRASCHTLRHSFATHLLHCVAFLPSDAEI